MGSRVARKDALARLARRRRRISSDEEEEEKKTKVKQPKQQLMDAYVCDASEAHAVNEEEGFLSNTGLVLFLILII